MPDAAPKPQNGRHLSLELRDMIQVGVFLIALGGAYRGITSRIEALSTDVGRVDRTVQVMDQRLWELQGRAGSASASRASLSPLPCSPDATRVALEWSAP